MIFTLIDMIIKIDLQIRICRLEIGNVFYIGFTQRGKEWRKRC